MTTSCEHFTKFLEETGYKIISGQRWGVVFACLNHKAWETLVVIRIADNGEAISTYNFILNTKEEITYELLEREYERCLKNPDPRSDEYKGYIAYNR